ncbi:hypothetical protein RDWZM_008857 [Blomia tropicalis]|uniref:Uncharacterized protein n=1 Tax=Blomia tropicalis TaxID=40697 RepID=A0A9Q0M5D5_BLOTA|nr:hypothetical protein RDWZM_008857 [Blomia tropicalis]
MPQSYEVDNTIVSPTNYKSVTEIEIAASASIQEPSSEENIQQSQQRGQPIYCSDGIIYPGEPNQTKIETVNQSDDQTVALSNDLVEVYQNLGLLGKLLAGGSLVTMRFLQGIVA